MRSVIISIALLLAFCSAASFAGEDRDLSGTYIAKGVGTNGGRYEGAVTLTHRGDTYLIHWHFAQEEYDGVGLRHGDVLSVGWSNKGKAGVVLYTIKGDTLDGEWADGSTDGKTFTETLTQSK